MGGLPRRALAEFVGTALLLAAVVGSGIAARRLSPGDTGLELLENALATGAALAAIIWCLGPVSGSHLNPVVSLVDSALGGLRARELPAYLAAQFLGAVTGVVVANLMWSLPAVTVSTQVRSGAGLWLGEVVATFGLVLVIFGLVRSHRPSAVPAAVGAYITAAYFFTSSTSFANPAVALARMLSNTFAGISPGSVAPFVAAELGGAALALVTIRALHPAAARAATPVTVLSPADRAGEATA
jgi:arsenate reductase